LNILEELGPSGGLASPTASVLVHNGISYRGRSGFFVGSVACEEDERVAAAFRLSIVAGFTLASFACGPCTIFTLRAVEVGF